MRTIRILNIVLLSMGIISTIGAQNFGRYANGTSPDLQITPSVNYSKDLEKAAKKDADGTITLQLADCYMYGLGVDKNEKKAIKLYESAAKKYNNGEAMLVSADYYAQNNQAEKAYDYYKQSVDANYAPAQVIYGDLLHAQLRLQYINKLNTEIKQCKEKQLVNDPANYIKVLEKQRDILEERYKKSLVIAPNGGTYATEETRKIAKEIEQIAHIIYQLKSTGQTKEMKVAYDKYAKEIEGIEAKKTDQQKIYDLLKASLQYRIVAKEFIDTNDNYTNYYKSAADQSYSEGMYAYAYYARDYDYMPKAAEVGYYILYTELANHYFDKILNNQDVSNSFSQLKKYSDLADQHQEESQKDFITNIESNTPEYLIKEAKDSMTKKSSLTNGKLAAMNYALTIANDTSKLKAYLVQIVLERFSKQQDTIFNNLCVTLDKVSGPEKIQFCSVNVNHKLYTQTIYKCLNHIIEHGKDNRTLGDAWCLLAELAQDGKIAEFNTKELKQQKYDEYMSKAKMYGSRKAFDYVTIKELESKRGLGLTYYYHSLRGEKKNEFNKWSPEVVNNCFYWMLKGDEQACLDYAQIMWDNHEGGVTPELDSTIIDAYQRAIDKGNETALYRQKAYKYLYAGGWGNPSVLEDIKTNGTPNELIKFSQTLLDMGDDGGKALPVIKLALEANSADAYYALYKLYEDKRVKDADVHNANKAMEALEKAVELGKTDAICELADNYFKGWGGIPSDEKKYVALLKRGQELGVRDATKGMAYCYAYGYGGTPINFDKAQELLTSIGINCDLSHVKRHYDLTVAANKNDLKAIHELISTHGIDAEHYETSAIIIGNTPDYNGYDRKEQMKWIKKGVALGDSESIRQLAWAYYYGWAGLKVDKNKTLSLLKQSAAKKNWRANANLGSCYEYGMDGFITPNRRQAAEYYRTAYNLGGGRDYEIAWLRCIN